MVVKSISTILKLIKGEIIEQNTDAIVNSANAT
jgi:O-acetyl-ADP-ribose deacetylase (regulator of RNase III)